MVRKGIAVMIDSPRCLYNNSFSAFLCDAENTVLGTLISNYHGEVRTTSIDAWTGEISIMQETLACLSDEPGHIIFEYDIPRLGKRVDVVLLYKGIIFCLEFKVGESKILETDVDQVLDYALDLKNFHRFSQDKVIVPILIATNYIFGFDPELKETTHNFVQADAAEAAKNNTLQQLVDESFG